MFCIKSTKFTCIYRNSYRSLLCNDAMEHPVNDIQKTCTCTSPKALIHNSTRVTWPTNACCKSTSFCDNVLALILGKTDES